MTVPTTTPSEPDFFAALERLHGHRCPMSVLGGRLGSAALRRLAAPPGSRLAARYHHQTCALDGIQLATGCTLGNGNLEVHPAGQHRLSLRTEAGDRSVTLELTAAALERGRAYGELRRRAQALPPDSPERRAAETALEALLQALQCAPEAELVADCAAPGA